MCYAIPAQVVTLEGQVGVVDYFGERRKILLDPEIVDVHPGDYVYEQDGILIRKIPTDEAQEILVKWRDFLHLSRHMQLLQHLTNTNYHLMLQQYYGFSLQ